MNWFLQEIKDSFKLKPKLKAPKYTQGDNMAKKQEIIQGKALDQPQPIPQPPQQQPEPQPQAQQNQVTIEQVIVDTLNTVVRIEAVQEKINTNIINLSQDVLDIKRELSKKK